jgi:hypothetical protein
MGLCHPKFGLLQNIKVIYFKTIALLTMRFEGAILADPKEAKKEKKNNYLFYQCCYYYSNGMGLCHPKFGLLQN